MLYCMCYMLHAPSRLCATQMQERRLWQCIAFAGAALVAMHSAEVTDCMKCSSHRLTNTTAAQHFSLLPGPLKLHWDMQRHGQPWSSKEVASVEANQTQGSAFIKQQAIQPACRTHGARQLPARTRRPVHLHPAQAGRRMQPAAPARPPAARRRASRRLPPAAVPAGQLQGVQQAAW